MCRPDAFQALFGFSGFSRGAPSFAWWIKPADSRLALLAPPFHTSACIPCRPGAGNHFWPHYPHHELQHHWGAQPMGNQGTGGCSSRPPCPRAKCTWKPSKELSWWLCGSAFTLFLTPQSTYSLKGAQQGGELSPAQFLDGGLDAPSCWCVLWRSRHSRHAVKWLQSPALSPHLQLCSCGWEESGDTWSSRYLCCVSLRPREASQCSIPKFPLDIFHPEEPECFRRVVPFLLMQWPLPRVCWTCAATLLSRCAPVSHGGTSGTAGQHLRH